METEERSVTFRDLAEFVHNEARVAANPVSGKITEDAKPKQEPRSGRIKSGSDGSKKSFAAQVGGDQNLPPGEPPSGTTPSVGNVSCTFCNSGHALETCEVQVSHIKTEFSSCCQNTFALVVYPLVTTPESAREGKYER